MTIVLFLVVLFVLILVHEFGHFVVAKWFGIRVDEFGIGFPPKAFGKKVGETEYTFNWLPIGGFVRIWGEDPTEDQSEDPDSERSFVNKPRLVQAAVLIAGVAMNVLLAFVLYTLVYMFGVPASISETETERLHEASLMVQYIVPNSPADQVLTEGDVITGIRSSDDFVGYGETLLPSGLSTFISERPDEELSMDIVRGGDPMTVTVIPEIGVNEQHPERAAAGFSMDLIVMERHSFLSAAHQAFARTYISLILITQGLGGLLVDAVQGDADYSQVAGPVGIVGLVGDMASLGMSWLLIFTAFISLNLAVINLLPIPALDGGRLVFVIIESIIRRPIRPIIATRVNQIGFIFLLSLMFLITVNDVINIFD